MDDKLFAVVATMGAKKRRFPIKSVLDEPERSRPKAWSPLKWPKAIMKPKIKPLAPLTKKRCVYFTCPKRAYNSRFFPSKIGHTDNARRRLRQLDQANEHVLYHCGLLMCENNIEMEQTIHQLLKDNGRHNKREMFWLTKKDMRMLQKFFPSLRLYRNDGAELRS